MLKLPLLVVDADGRLDIFRTPQTMSSRLEAIDVRAGEYRVFDCTGVEYAVVAESDTAPVLVGSAIGDDPALVRELAERWITGVRPTGRSAPGEVNLATADDICQALTRFAL